MTRMRGLFRKRSISDSDTHAPILAFVLGQFCFLPHWSPPVHLPVHGVDLGMTVTGAATLLTWWVVQRGGSAGCWAYR